MMKVFIVGLLFLLLPILTHAQPSPALQDRIFAAIKDSANKTDIDYTQFVNPFIGTGKRIQSYRLFGMFFISVSRQLWRCLVRESTLIIYLYRTVNTYI